MRQGSRVSGLRRFRDVSVPRETDFGKSARPTTILLRERPRQLRRPCGSPESRCSCPPEPSTPNVACLRAGLRRGLVTHRSLWAGRPRPAMSKNILVISVDIKETRVALIEDG